MSYVVGFDYGTKSIGVAVGQQITNTASELTVVNFIKGAPDWLKISNLISEWSPDFLVVGLPLNMDGSQQHLTVLAKKFGDLLRNKYNKPVFFYDERLTTYSAKHFLINNHGLKSLNKKRIDSVSACLILEGYLASCAS